MSNDNYADELSKNPCTNTYGCVNVIKKCIDELGNTLKVSVFTNGNA